MRRSGSSRKSAGLTNKNTSLVTGLGMDMLVPNHIMRGTRSHVDSQVCQDHNNNSSTSTPFPFHFHHQFERDTKTLSEEQTERIELFSHDVNL